MDELLWMSCQTDELAHGRARGQHHSGSSAEHSASIHARIQRQHQITAHQQQYHAHAHQTAPRLVYIKQCQYPDMNSAGHPAKAKGPQPPLGQEGAPTAMNSFTWGRVSTRWPSQ